MLSIIRTTQKTFSKNRFILLSSIVLTISSSIKFYLKGKQLKKIKNLHIGIILQRIKMKGNYGMVYYKG